jgi:hypothetical protein
LKDPHQIPGITEIINMSELDLLQDEITKKQLVKKAEIPIMSFVEVSLGLVAKIFSPCP